MRIYVIGAAVIAALAIPATASANVVDLTCVNGHPQASMIKWRIGAVVSYRFTVNGTTADSGSVRIASNPQALTSTAVLTGDHDLYVSVSGYSASARVSCGTPPPASPPPPPPPEATPAVQGGPASTPARAVVPAKRAVPAARAKAKVKARVTCVYLRRVGAGPLTYARLGLRNRCRPIRVAQVPIIPPVTG